MFKPGFLAIVVSLCVLAPGITRASPSTRPSSSGAGPTALDPSARINLSWFEDAVQSDPAVAYDDIAHHHLVVWSSEPPGGNRRLFLAHVRENGDVAKHFVLPGPHDRSEPAIAFDPVARRYLVTWAEDVSDDGSNWDIHGVFVDPFFAQPELGEAFAINSFPTIQSDPRVVYAEGLGEFFVLWTNSYVDGTLPDYLSGRRIRSDGSFPSSRVDLTLAEAGAYRLHPDLAYDPEQTQYLVVWEEVGSDRDIMAQRLTHTGSPIASPFGVAAWPGSEERPAVAFCQAGASYLVTWQALQPGANYDLYARTVSAAGEPGRAGEVHAVPHARETDPDVACAKDGRSFIVSWTQQYAGLFGPTGIWAQEVGPDLALGWPLVLATPHAGASKGHGRPSIVPARRGFFAAWEHELGANEGHAVYGRLLQRPMLALPWLRR